MVESKEVWHEVYLDEILKHWVKGYDFKDDSKIVDYKWYIDTHKNRVAIKLVTRKETDQ